MADFDTAPNVTIADFAAVRLLGEMPGSPSSLVGVPTSVLLEIVSAAVTGQKRYATTALRDADTQPAGTLGYVYLNNGSASDAANGYYQSTGTAWASATWFSNVLIAVVQPLVDLATSKADLATAKAAEAVSASNALIAAYANVLQRAAGAAAYNNVGFINATGVYSASAGYATTGFVPVEGGQSYTVNAAYAGGAYTLAWYDANQAFISSARAASGALQTLTATSPSNARFARSTTTTANIAASYIQTAASRLSIDMITAIMAMFPQISPSEKVSHNGTTAKAQFDAHGASLIALTSALANLSNENDVLTDRFNTNFVDWSKITLSHLCVDAAPPEEVTILSRNSASQITVSTGMGAQYVAGAGIVIFDGTADLYKVYGIKSVAGDVITVFGTLPTTCTKCMCTMDTSSTEAGQHASLYLLRAAADDLLTQTTRTTFRKANPIFAYHPVNCTSAALSNPNIYLKSNTTTPFIAVTALNGAVGGGWVAGTSNSLGKACGNATVDVNATGAQPLNAMPQRYYEIADAVAGRGIEYNVPMGGFDGFIKIKLAALRVPYTGGTAEGRVRLEVLADGVSIHDMTYDPGMPVEPIINWSRQSVPKIRITLADSAPTVIRHYGTFAYKKAPVSVDLPLIRDGDNVLVGPGADSWSQYPITWAGITKPPRVDGGTAEGTQAFTERLKSKAASMGRNIIVRNYGKGQTTTKYALYWLPSTLAANPDATVVIDCNTLINDLASSNSSPASPYAWDFHPTDRWSFLSSLSGGVPGRVMTPAEAWANKRKFAEMVTAKGMRCITYTPPHYSGAGGAYTLTCTWGHLFAAGFEALPS